jgi:hypothetical protein
MSFISERQIQKVLNDYKLNAQDLQELQHSMNGLLQSKYKAYVAHGGNAARCQSGGRVSFPMQYFDPQSTSGNYGASGQGLVMNMSTDSIVRPELPMSGGSGAAACLNGAQNCKAVSAYQLSKTLKGGGSRDQISQAANYLNTVANQFVNRLSTAVKNKGRLIGKSHIAKALKASQ